MSKSHDVTTRAVVVGRAQSGEGSARVFLYTEEFGLVSAFAKSAREERSKLRAHLQVGTSGSFTLVRGAHEWRVTGAYSTENLHFSLSENHDAQRAHSRVLSLVRQLVHGEEKNRELFQTLWDFFEALPQLETDTIKIAEYLAVLRMLASLGYVAPHPAIPHIHTISFSPPDVLAIKPFERELVHAINTALFSSGLS